jgi:hypothetical protein
MKVKRATTQDIVMRANATKLFSGSWHHVYITVSEMIRDTEHYRTFRSNNTFLLYEIADKEQGIAAGPVFSINAPRIRAEAYVEFAKALQKSGFKHFQSYVDNPLTVRLLEEAGFEVGVGESVYNHKGVEEKELHVLLADEGEQP